MTLDKQHQLKEKISTSLTVATFTALTLLFFGPLQIYLPNSRMFSYMFDKVVLKFLPVTAIALLLIAVVLSLLPSKFNIHRKFTALTLGGAILLWLQGNILLWDYGVLDGSNIKWNELLYRGIIDGLIWILIITVVLVKSEQIYKYVKKISFFFIIMQLLYSGFLFFQYPAARAAKNFKLFDESIQFNFSSKRNVIILVIDGFQSDLFQEIADENEQLKQTFDGFTYYRNNLAGFPLTLPSVPLILTGQRYDNSIPFEEFTANAYFTPSSIPLVLRQHGFRVDILMDSGRCFIKDERLISNLTEGEIPLSNSQAGYLFDLTLFKTMPHFLKKIVYNNQKWRFVRYLRFETNKKIRALPNKLNPAAGKNFSKKALDELYDVKFTASMLNETSVETDRPVFKYFHLKGIHAPFRMNEKLEYEEMTKDRSHWKRLGKGALKIAELFLVELKRLNIYDNSMIFIMGDHGHSAGEFGIRFPPGLDKGPARKKGVPPQVIESGIPLLLVKRPNDTGEMKTSDSPVSVSDIPVTVFTALGITGEFTGEDMFRVAPDAVRTRRFSFFVWKRGTTIGEFFPTMKDYIVTGHSWRAESWEVRPKSATGI